MAFKEIKRIKKDKRKRKKERMTEKKTEKRGKYQANREIAASLFKKAHEEYKNLIES
jgi:hypothetical protein